MNTLLQHLTYYRYIKEHVNNKSNINLYKFKYNLTAV